MPDFVATHRLTEAASLKMLAAGVAKANELGCKVSLAVVDQSCRLIAFLMMDGARHFSIITTQRKAIPRPRSGSRPATRPRKTR
jgi:glc operon protein GlcG